MENPIEGVVFEVPPFSESPVKTMEPSVRRLDQFRIRSKANWLGGVRPAVLSSHDLSPIWDMAQWSGFIGFELK